MPVTALDPKTALIVIDLQRGLVAFPTVHPIADVVAQAVTLVEAFRRRGLPVVLVNVAGVPPGRTEQASPVRQMPEGWTELIPEPNRQPTDHTVTKYSRGAFTHTGLEAYLRAQGVTQVVVVGVATSAGVESTARQAHEFGFNVTLAADAMTDLDPDAHAHSITRIFSRLGETGTTAEIIALLDARA